MEAQISSEHKEQMTCMKALVAEVVKASMNQSRTELMWKYERSRLLSAHALWLTIIPGTRSTNICAQCEDESKKVSHIFIIEYQK